MANKAFPKSQHVLDFLANDLQVDLRQRDPQISDRRLLERLKKFIKGLKIEYQIPSTTPGDAGQRRVYTIHDVGPSPDQARFDFFVIV